MTQENQAVEFKTVSEYVNHLEESGQDTVNVADVISTIKEIQARPVDTNRRGKLAGIALEDMSDEELKREIINAKSVLYKAQKREAAAATIEQNQARVDAAIAEKDKRTPAKEEAPETAMAEDNASKGTDTDSGSEDIYENEEI